MNKQQLFIEHQPLGYNLYSTLLRSILAIFCFTAYYSSENKEMNADFLYLLGIVILVFNIVLFFIPYFTIKITNEKVELKGFLIKRHVSIPISQIISIELITNKYSLMAKPLFNVHKENAIIFFVSGKKSIKLITKEGLTYFIGIYQAESFHKATKH